MHSYSGALSLPKCGNRPWRSCSPAQPPHWQGALSWEVIESLPGCPFLEQGGACEHPKISNTLLLLQEVHKERIALETQLEQLRPVTVL